MLQVQLLLVHLDGLLCTSRKYSVRGLVHFLLLIGLKPGQADIGSKSIKHISREGENSGLFLPHMAGLSSTPRRNERKFVEKIGNHVDASGEAWVILSSGLSHGHSAEERIMHARLETLPVERFKSPPLVELVGRSRMVFLGSSCYLEFRWHRIF